MVRRPQVDTVAESKLVGTYLFDWKYFGSLYVYLYNDSWWYLIRTGYTKFIFYTQIYNSLESWTGATSLNHWIISLYWAFTVLWLGLTIHIMLHGRIWSTSLLAAKTTALPLDNTLKWQMPQLCVSDIAPYKQLWRRVSLNWDILDSLTAERVVFRLWTLRHI